MRSGDRPGLQNRRAAGSPSPVGSTPTRFRQFLGSLDFARDFACRLPLRSRRQNGSTSKPAGGGFPVAGGFDPHSLPPVLMARALQLSRRYRENA